MRSLPLLLLLGCVSPLYAQSVSPGASILQAAVAGGVNANPFGNPYSTYYAYDALNNLLRVDQKGTAPGDSTQWRTRTFTYNSLSQLLTANNPETSNITYTYDNDGNLLTKKDGRAITITYGYDMNRLVSKSYTNSSNVQIEPTVTYSYDSNNSCTAGSNNGIGRRSSMADASGSASWCFDAMGRPVSEQRTIGAVTKPIQYSYNKDGSLLTVTYPSGRTITYGYSNAGNATTATDVANNINYVSNATHLPSGGLSGALYGHTGSFAGITLNNQFSLRLQPSLISASSPAMTLFSLSYSFNQGSAQSPVNNGNVVQIQNNRDNSRTQTFAYDLLNRVASGKSQATSGTNCWGENFTYDAWGNLLQRTANQTGSGCQYESLSVSADGNNHVGGWNYDAAGNILVDGTYSYNSENHLATAEGVTYTYDGDGQRVQKSGGKMYWRGTDGEPLEESDLSGNINEEYIFLGGRPIARTDLPSGSVHFYFSDHLGSASVIANATGTTIEQESDYYPFGGERTVAGGPNTYKFTGKERDSETGLDNFEARMYGSTFGRFTSPDEPFADQEPGDPQSWNLFVYVRNNPLSNVDDDGHDCIYPDGYGGGYVVRGDCSNPGGKDDDGIYVDGTIDVNSFQYNAANNSSSFSYTTDSGLIGMGVLQGPALSDGFAPGSLAYNTFGPPSAAYWRNSAGFVNAIGNLEANVMAPSAVAIAGCASGGSKASCGANMALSLLPEVKALREGATLLKEASAVGKGAEILKKGGGSAQAIKDFESLSGTEKIYGKVRVKTLSDGSTKAVLYNSTGGSGKVTIAIQRAGSVTKIRY